MVAIILVILDTDVAPLWDPDKRMFVGIMTANDYIQTLRLWINQGLSSSELLSRTINEMIITFPNVFKQTGFHGIDAEDTVLQMCLLLLQSNYDYVPIIDASNGNLVSILGFLDVVYLFCQAAQQYPTLFNQSIEESNIGTYHRIITVTKTVKLFEILNILETHDISGVPVVDEITNRVCGYYHRSDVSFIIKATDTDMILSNLLNIQVQESMLLREELIHTGAIMSNFQGLVVCHKRDMISTVLHNMVRARSCRAVIVDEYMVCIGMITIKDIIRLYIEHST